MFARNDLMRSKSLDDCTVFLVKLPLTVYLSLNVIRRARIFMQKHIFSMWDESKDASKSEEFSMKGVAMQKL